MTESLLVSYGSGKLIQLTLEGTEVNGRTARGTRIQPLVTLRRSNPIWLVLWQLATIWRFVTKQGYVVLWHWPSREPIRLESAGTFGARKIRFSPDGDYLAVVTNKQLIVWSTNNGNIVDRVKPAEIPTAFEFSPNANEIAFATDNGEVVIRDFLIQSTQSQFSSPSKCSDLAFSPDGSSLASTSRDGSVRLRNVETGESVTLGSHVGPALRLVFASDGETITSTGADKTAIVWRVASIAKTALPRDEFWETSDGFTTLGDSFSGELVLQSFGEDGSPNDWNGYRQSSNGKTLAISAGETLFSQFSVGESSQTTLNLNSLELTGGFLTSTMYEQQDSQPLMFPDLTQVLSFRGGNVASLWDLQGDSVKTIDAAGGRRAGGDSDQRKSVCNSYWTIFPGLFC